MKRLTFLFAALALPISIYPGIVSAINIFFTRNEDYINSSNNIQHIALLTSSASLSNSTESAAQIVDKSALENGGSTEALSGQQPTSDQISIYVVREGDTLSQIAEMFNVTVNTIKWNNDIKSNLVRPGDTLVILPISGVRHTVKRGDTVDSIAKTYKGDRSEIIAYNDISGPLSVGSVIIVPDGEIAPTVSGSIVVGGSSLKEYSGYYLRPVVGGRRTQGIHGYNGVDIAASAGTPVLASAAGQVIVSRNSGWNGGYGNYVVIKHSNGTQTLYAHLSNSAVSVGDEVTQGETVGYMGRTGKATGVHLHFEIRGAKNPF